MFSGTIPAYSYNCAPCFPSLEAPIRTFLVSLIGATAVAAGILVVRTQRQSSDDSAFTDVPPGENVPAEIVLERLRRAGI